MANYPNWPTYRVACYIHTYDGRSAQVYPFGLAWQDVLPRPPIPKPPRESVMARLAQAYHDAHQTNGGHIDRRALFLHHMGRTPSRAYMAKIVRLARSNGKG